MSDFDDMDIDDDELDDLWESNEDNLTPEDVFSMVMINVPKKSKMKAELHDAEGDEIELAHVMTQITGYIKDKMNDKEGNQFADQIMPLMSQACVSVLGRMIGIPSTGFILSNPMTREAVLFSMCSAFLLLKWVQEKDVTIHTVEESVTDEEIDTIERKSKANSMATMGSYLGQDPKAILRELRKQGKITREDLTDMLGESEEDEDNEDNN